MPLGSKNHSSKLSRRATAGCLWPLRRGPGRCAYNGVTLITDSGGRWRGVFFLIFSQRGTVVSLTGSMVLHAKPALTTAVQAFKRAKTATTRANLHRSRHAALPLFVTFIVLQLDSEGSDQKVQKRTGCPVPVTYRKDQLIYGSFCVPHQRGFFFFFFLIKPQKLPRENMFCFPTSKCTFRSTTLHF